jgi:sensor histidine kinase YesM
MIFITVNTVSELLCLLAAIFFLYKEKTTAWRLFIPFLLLTCTVEIAGIYIREFVHTSNYALYNVYVLFECGFTSYFFFYLYKAYHYKPIWLYAWLGQFAVMYIIDLLHHNFGQFVSTTASVMSVVFVLASLYFYYLKLKDEHFEPLIFSAPFWWVSGTLFFYFGSTACNNFLDYLSEYERITFSRSIRYIIYNILDIIMYIFWSYAFICRYRQRKSSPSLG